MAKLAFRDLAVFLVDNNSVLAKKLTVSLANQTWASSQFTAPTNMLFYKQKKTTTIDFAGVMAHQVEDRRSLSMIASTPEIKTTYYALEGKTFHIKHFGGTTSGTDLNIHYYKIPAIADIDDELMPLLMDFVLKRLIPSNVDKIDRDMTGKGGGQ